VSTVNRSDVIPSPSRTWPPAFIAGRERSAVLIQHQRKCQHCRGVAMRDKLVCRRHAGRIACASEAHGRGERRILQRMDRLGLIPGALAALPAWQALDLLPTSVRSPLRLRLVLLWAERDTQPLAFAQALRQASEAGDRFAPGGSPRIVVS